MRLRRETGDFQIRINPSNGTNAIRTGLSAEDFAGELININGTIEPVLSVSESEGVVTAKTATYTVTYNKETGAIASSEGGAGGSGGGGEKQFPEIVITCASDDNGSVYTIVSSDLTYDDVLAMSASGNDHSVLVDYTEVYTPTVGDAETYSFCSLCTSGVWNANDALNGKPALFWITMTRNAGAFGAYANAIIFSQGQDGELLVAAYQGGRGVITFEAN